MQCIFCLARNECDCSFSCDNSYLYIFLTALDFFLKGIRPRKSDLCANHTEKDTPSSHTKTLFDSSVEALQDFETLPHAKHKRATVNEDVMLQVEDRGFVCIYNVAHGFNDLRVLVQPSFYETLHVKKDCAMLDWHQS
jgi:hypothetical protein